MRVIYQTKKNFLQSIDNFAISIEIYHTFSKHSYEVEDLQYRIHVATAALVDNTCKFRLINFLALDYHLKG